MEEICTKEFCEAFGKEFAYMCGFIWADGYINKDGSIRVECVKEDIDKISPTFLTCFDWTTYCRTRPNRRPQATLYLRNKKFYDWLCEKKYHLHSIESAKDAVNSFPKKLQKYWLRGLIDGDGCWYYHEKRGLRQFSLAGSFDQEWDYFTNFLEEHNIKHSIQKTIGQIKSHKYSRVRVSGKENILTLGHYLYDTYNEDKIGLQRKFLKWKEIEKSCDINQNCRAISIKDKKTGEIFHFESRTQALKELSVDRTTINKWINKKQQSKKYEVIKS